MANMLKYSPINDRIGFVDRKLYTTKEINIHTNFAVKKLNSVAKAAILNLLAGYKDSENVTVLGEDLNKYIKDYNHFASVNMNIINAGPHMFNMNIVFLDQKNIKYQSSKNILEKFDTILMLSGGIDSVSGLFYALDKGWKVLPLWINFGQKNKVNEDKTVRLIEKTFNIPVMRIKIDLKKYIDSGWETWKYGIIPSRNFMFLALASLIIEQSQARKIRVLLCATRDEYNAKHEDKSPIFFKTISRLLTRYTRKNIEVITPFVEYNKTEIMAYWSIIWAKKYNFQIRNTISCYNNNFCGSCPACYNRNLYGSASGYLDDIRCKNDPFRDRARMIRDYHINNFNKWDNTRKLDFLNALSLHMDKIPPEVKKFLNLKKIKYQNQMEKRLIKLKNMEIK
jgi:7-cyano-7-deazaguanine synthase